MISYKVPNALGLIYDFLKRYSKPLLLGMLYGFSFRPSSFLPLCGLTCLGLFFHDLLKQKTPSLVNKNAYVFFVCAKFFSLYWIGYAFSGMGYLAVGLISSFLLSSFIAFFYLTAGCFLNAISSCHRVYFLAFGIWVSEYITSIVCTGFPWNLTAHLWGMLSLGWQDIHPIADWPLAVMQIASILGVHGLSLLTLIWISGIVIFIENVRGYKKLSFVITVLITVSVPLFGFMRLKHNPTQFDTTIPKIRLVQPCVDPNQKWHPDHLNNIIHGLLELSFKEVSDNVGMIVWPEAAVPLRMNKQIELKKFLATFLLPHLHLVTGCVLHESTNDYSAMIAINHTANIVQAHRKGHIVPFGEYIPLKKWIPLHKLTPGSQDYTPGPRVSELRLNRYPPFLPLICYEAIFPYFLRDQSKYAQEKSKWILNITNDAWYGDSAGLWQHLANVRFRSIEEGLPLIRVANNGISGVIDAVGRIVFKTPIDERGFYDIALPQALGATWFVRYYHLIHLVFILGLVTCCYFGRSKYKK